MMKRHVLTMAAALASVVLMFTGGGMYLTYSMEPDGYGFHDIWAAELMMTASLTIAGVVLMVYAVRKIERKLF